MNARSDNFKRKIWIIFIFAVFPAFLFSQVDSAWVRRYDGPVHGEDEVTSMTVDNSGNVYVTGWSYGIHHEDYTTIEYDTEGNEIWVARYNHPYNGGDCALALAVDSSGNAYVTGLAESAYAIGTIKYDGNGNVIWENIHEPPYWDNHGTDIVVDAYGNVYVAAFCVTPEAEYRLIKYDDFGNIIWERSYSQPYIEFPVLAIDNQNNIFIAGASWRNYPSAEYIVIKYDETGTELWMKFYNSPADSTDFINAIAVDDSGYVYVTGQSLGIGCGFDYVTIKYDNDGNQLWVERYNGPGNGDDRANAIAVDNFGNVYVAGGSEGDYATVKYNSAGIEQWVVRYNGSGSGSSRSNSMVIDSACNVYVTGGSEGDYATVKYNSAGTEQWVVRYNGLGNGTDEAYSIAIDGSNNVYVAGKSMGSGTDYDYATIKYVQGTGIEEEDGSEMEVRGSLLLTVTPNPFSSEVRIQISEVGRKSDICPLTSDLYLHIYDISGRVVKNFSLPTAYSILPTVFTWDGRDELGNEVQSGVYFCKLKSNRIERMCRIILLR
ncbi:SBBP repeat-containing protein [candidate division WOR-3 bacterium]|nr:SBBP repeat-containing protein [candidate division WOR-3 bacterium]